VKRDAERGIIKTPQDEYTFPAMLSLGGKEAKITMTFVEEDSETGDKWIIVDSNLHIIGKVLVPAQAQPTTIPPKGPLTSNALNTPPSTKPATQTPTVVPKNNIPPENTKTPSQPPLASKAIQKPVPAKVPPMISQPSDSTGL
jgi:hypothetical protein